MLRLENLLRGRGNRELGEISSIDSNLTFTSLYSRMLAIVRSERESGPAFDQEMIPLHLTCTDAATDVF